MTKTQWTKLYAGWKEELQGIEPIEVQTLLALRNDLRRITRWDDWLSEYWNYVPEKKERYEIDRGRQAIEDEREDE